MNKQEFLFELKKGLSGLPQEDIDERLSFYSEMIDDRIEEGLTESQAVSAIGSVDEIIAQIIAEVPLTQLVKERIKPKRQLKTWEIVLLVLGSPIWFSLLFAAIIVFLSLYISLWAVIISLWAIFASLGGCSIGGVISCVVFAVNGNIASGVAVLAAGIVTAGLTIFMFYGCKVLTAGSLILTKKMAIWIKNCFRGKEDAQ